MLEALKQTLVEGQKLSMQGSMDRRAPAKKAVPFLLKARQGLKEYLKENETNHLAWRLLSQAEECLQNYNHAIYCLQRAMVLDKKNQKDLKRLALLTEYRGMWEELNLTTEQLESLGSFLNEKLTATDCDHSLKFTKIWLEESVPKSKISKIVKEFQNQGGFCDCEVLYNVMD
jgi:tetratricopeptide (TPR) repeat protein